MTLAGGLDNDGHGFGLRGGAVAEAAVTSATAVMTAGARRAALRDIRRSCPRTLAVTSKVRMDLAGRHDSRAGRAGNPAVPGPYDGQLAPIVLSEGIQQLPARLRTSRSRWWELCVAGRAG
jgi:hypothetical protein